jgi:outer membrane protein assembly factor BamB
MFGLAAFANSSAAQSGARNVAMFRGDATRSGVFPAPSGQALAGLQWRFMTNGDVISSPVALGNAVYVGSGDGNLYSLDAKAGTKKWAFDAGNAIHSSPAIGAGAVYIGTRDGHF